MTDDNIFLHDSGPEASEQVDVVIDLLPERIRALREKRRLTPEQLAENVGLTPERICKFETGANTPSLKTIQQIAEALRVPLVAFFHKERESPKVDRELLSPDTIYFNTRREALLAQRLLELLRRMNPSQRHELMQVADRILAGGEGKQATLAEEITDVPWMVSGETALEGVLDERFEFQLQALAHPTRRRILELLKRKGSSSCERLGPDDAGLCLGELQAELPNSSRAIQYHAQTLFNAGLVRRRRIARWVHYWRDERTLTRLSGLLRTLNRWLK